MSCDEVSESSQSSSSFLRWLRRDDAAPGAHHRVVKSLPSCYASQLLESGAIMRIKDREMWPTMYRVLHQLKSDPEFVVKTLQIGADQAASEALRRGPYMHAALAAIPDLTATVKFEFNTWVPLLGRLLPSDTCVLRKIGAGVRLDCSLAGFTASRLAWRRGQLSFILTEPEDRSYIDAAATSGPPSVGTGAGGTGSSQTSSSAAVGATGTPKPTVTSVASVRKGSISAQSLPATIGRLYLVDHINKRYAELTSDENDDDQPDGGGGSRRAGSEDDGGGDDDASAGDVDDEKHRKELMKHARQLSTHPWPNVDVWSREVTFTPEPKPAPGFFSSFTRSTSSRSAGSTPKGSSGNAATENESQYRTEAVGDYTGVVYKVHGMKVKVEVRQPMSEKSKAEKARESRAKADAMSLERGDSSKNRVKSEDERRRDVSAIPLAAGAAAGNGDGATATDQPVKLASFIGTGSPTESDSGDNDDDDEHDEVVAADGIAGRIAGSAAGRALSALVSQLALGQDMSLLAGEGGGIQIDPAAVPAILLESASYTVGCGKAESVTVDLAAGAAVQWSVACERHDVGLSVAFQADVDTGAGSSGSDGSDVVSGGSASARSPAPDGDDPPMVPPSAKGGQQLPEQPLRSSYIEIASVARTASHIGSWTALYRGTVTMTLDNTYAMWHDKKLRIRLERVGVDGSRAADAAGGGAAGALDADGDNPSPSPTSSAASGASSNAALASASGPARIGKRIKGFETHPLAALIPENCGLAAMKFEDYFKLPPAAVRSDLGLDASALPDTSTQVFIAPPPSTKFEKTLNARVVMCPDFPLTVQQLLPVAEVLSRTAKHFSNVHRFLTTRMPDGAGFPVSFDIPVLPAIGLAAKVQFTSAALLKSGSTDSFGAYTGDGDLTAGSASTASSSSTAALRALVALPKGYADATEDLANDKFFDKTGSTTG